MKLGEHKMIFKAGDDVRQDQFILQMITMMDKLIKEKGFDLKMRTYKALALTHDPKNAGDDCGIIEMVPESLPIEDILYGKKQKTLSEYFKEIISKKNENNPVFSFSSLMDEIKDNFSKSLAGMSVLTYILGIGDRHLNNLMVTNDGKFVTKNFFFNFFFLISSFKLLSFTLILVMFGELNPA